MLIVEMCCRRWRNAEIADGRNTDPYCAMTVSKVLPEKLNRILSL